jgi:epoxyqueuosine reductase
MSLPVTAPFSIHQLKQKAQSLGFHKVGIAAVSTETDESAPQRLKAWQQSGLIL